MLGLSCREDGSPLPPGSPPHPYTTRSPDDWFPYHDRIGFETADLLFREAEMSRSKLNRLMEVWGASIHQAIDGASMSPPYTNSEDMLKTIDATLLGDVRWRCFTVSYNGVLPEGDPPTWMTKSHEVWF